MSSFQRTVKRLTVSLSDDLIAFVRDNAHDTKRSVSAVVADALRKLSREERDRRISAELFLDAQEDQAETRLWIE